VWGSFRRIDDFDATRRRTQPRSFVTLGQPTFTMFEVLTLSAFSSRMCDEL